LNIHDLIAYNYFYIIGVDNYNFLDRADFNFGTIDCKKRMKYYFIILFNNIVALKSILQNNVIEEANKQIANLAEFKNMYRQKSEVLKQKSIFI
jgi:hypothetical protein